jgi:hypothetical protein
MDSKQYAFSAEELKDYFFELKETLFGYDQQGQVWEGEELIEMRTKGLIVKEFPHKTVFHRKTLSLLGFIEETFDKTWWAYSPYRPPKMSLMDTFGFSDEFYAVRYLHQILCSRFPNDVQEIKSFPKKQLVSQALQCEASWKTIFFKQYANSEALKNYTFEIKEELSYGYDQQGHMKQGAELAEQRKQGLIIKECPYKLVFLDNALIGHIQQTIDATWIAHSLFYPPEMSDMEVCGFANEFYAALYLHYIALSKYPESVEEIPRLPWEREKTEGDENL